MGPQGRARWRLGRGVRTRPNVRWQEAELATAAWRRARLQGGRGLLVGLANAGALPRSQAALALRRVAGGPRGGWTLDQQGGLRQGLAARWRGGVDGPRQRGRYRCRKAHWPSGRRGFAARSRGGLQGPAKTGVLRRPAELALRPARCCSLAARAWWVRRTRARCRDRGHRPSAGRSPATGEDTGRPPATSSAGRGRVPGPQSPARFPRRQRGFPPRHPCRISGGQSQTRQPPGAQGGHQRHRGPRIRNDQDHHP